MKLDAQGFVVDALPARVRCLYTMPHHQYPTTVLMSPARRLVLLERARSERFAILEDERGVAFAIARDFALDRKPRPFIRLAFARYTEAELADAIRVLVRALR